MLIIRFVPIENHFQMSLIQVTCTQRNSASPKQQQSMELQSTSIHSPKMPIRSNRQPFSNITHSSELHPAKLCAPKTTTEDGITIDFNPNPPKADLPITSVLEPFSKTTTDTHSLTLEHNLTDEKIQRDRSRAEREGKMETLCTSPLWTIF
jgi:hypothetical protein